MFLFQELRKKRRVRASFIWVLNWVIWNTEQHDTKTAPCLLFDSRYSEWKPQWNMARVNTNDIKEVDQNLSVLSWWEVFTSIKKASDFRVYILDLFLNDVQKINLEDEYWFINAVKPNHVFLTYLLSSLAELLSCSLQIDCYLLLLSQDHL